MEQTLIQLSLPVIAIAWQPTKFIVELVKFKVAEAEIPLPQTVGQVTEETKAISTQESVVQEAWHGWEESLGTAHRMQQVTVAALWDESRRESSVCVRILMPEEWESYEKWREQFLEEQESFEEDGMEVDAFGMDD